MNNQLPPEQGASAGPEATVDAMIKAQLAAAKEASRAVKLLPTWRKNGILRDAALHLENCTSIILERNARDLEAGRAAGMNQGLLDRLALSEDRVKAMADGLRQVADLADPVGQIVRGHRLANGIELKQVRVPLGVVGMIYEARPNVTVDAFGLALKSGNVALLRGSKSAQETNWVLVDMLQQVLEAHNVPREAVQLFPCDSHDTVQRLITARGQVDVVIPRGGAGLIKAVVENATVPTIETGVGNCHTYVDASADADKAEAIVLNGKTRRCSVCNATETLLLDKGLDAAVSLRLIRALQDAGVTVHGDVTELEALGATGIETATDADWADEYLSMDIAVKLVDGVGGAIDHIARYSTGHTEAIVADSAAACRRFEAEVDAAAVMINASTAFTDGEQYGFGAEIGISTQKLHARGPMALPELTSTKWVGTGDGQVRPQ